MKKETTVYRHFDCCHWLSWPNSHDRVHSNGYGCLCTEYGFVEIFVWHNIRDEKAGMTADFVKPGSIPTMYRLRCERATPWTKAGVARIVRQWVRGRVMQQSN